MHPSKSDNCPFCGSGVLQHHRRYCPEHPSPIHGCRIRPWMTIVACALLMGGSLGGAFLWLVR